MQNDVLVKFMKQCQVLKRHKINIQIIFIVKSQFLIEIFNKCLCSSMCMKILDTGNQHWPMVPIVVHP